MKTLPWVVVLTVLVVSPPYAAAQTQVLQSATVDLTAPLDPLAAQLFNQTDSTGGAGSLPDVGGAAGGCGAGTFAATQTTLDFDDGGRSTGCAEAVLTLTPPAGATQAIISFQVDRRITGATGGGPGPVVVMPQQFRTYLDGQLESAADIFAEGDRGSDVAERREYAIALVPGVAQAIAWYGEDRGYTVDPALPSFGEADSFEFTVSALDVTYRGVPVQDVQTVDGPHVDDEDTLVRTQTTFVNVTVPPEWMAPARASLTVAAGAREFAGWRVDGHAQGGALNTTTTANSILITLDAARIHATGPGVYSFVFLTTSSLPAPAPPLPPTVIDSLFFGFAGAPILAGAGATYTTTRYRMEAKGIYRRTAWLLFAAVIAILVYYVVLAVFSFTSFGPKAMGTFPLSSSALLVYIQFAIITVSLILIAIFVAGSSTRVMRADIAERDEHARELERSNRELEQFAYVASHDLQEPLRKVASFSKMLKKKYDGDLDEKAHLYLDYTMDGALRMQTLVRDLLQFSRLGRNEPVLETVDLDGVLAAVQDDLEARIREVDGQVTVAPLPDVRADPGLVHQVFLNLVGNALKYHAPDRSPVVRVDFEEGPHAWRFRVRDNGIGIAPEHRERIFAIFQRLHGRGEYDGTGIGLAICQKIVEAHGGTIGVDSVVGAGSTFHFTLPKVAA